MILTTHLLSGAALGANIQNPVAVAGLSVALHFLLDTLPHGDYLNRKSKMGEFWKVALDLTIGFSVVVAALFFQNLTLNSDFSLKNIAVGMFFSLLPDGLTFCYWKLKMTFLKPVYDFHQSLHRFKNGSPERKFALNHNIWDIIISLTSVFILIAPLLFSL